MSELVVYIRMRHKVEVKVKQQVKIGDLAQVIADPSIREKIIHLPIHKVDPSDKNFVLIDVMKVILAINKVFPDSDVQSIGAAHTILEVRLPTKKIEPVYFVFIWLLLFIGAGMAIMNFHEDVSMREVHQRMFITVTGNEIAKPLILQIPYSIGLGLGMILFFNHVFRKRLNEEPSPLEVEMFKYQQDLDQYITYHENSESETKLNDN
ncbi:stage V sporulation protein AA [Alkalihalophilus pseudofirmus]|uniref:stage V sporulation protein AA n=1 Tax=Alkalihalobacterium alkalinitrilicum TaxID=427920 RepID=UPI00094D33DB|nr:stage V sporulation protein AA [Alkalihalobacterium alkalinitrilicum]OLO42672.1 stage V sporulation protein AA [Alkalihalophilus pseudofirmus]